MFTTQNRPLRSASLIAGLVAVLLLSTARPTFATLVIDLRFSSSASDKTLNVTNLAASTTVVIQVWATVTGANTILTDDGLSSTFLGMLSANATANLTGNLTAASFVTPFDLAPPATDIGIFNVDRNADGISDWRGTATNVTSGWPKASAGSSTMISTGGATGQASASDPTHSWEFHIADAVFTIGSISTAGISGTQTVLAYNPLIPLPTITAGKASWREDNVSKSGTATQPGAGTGVIFTIVGAGGGNPDIDPTPTSLPFGNLLLNAPQPGAQNVTLTNNGTAAGNYTTSTTGVAVVTSGGSGSINAGANTLMGVGLSAGITTTYGANKTGTVVVATTGDFDPAATDTVTVTVTIGEAATGGNNVFGVALTGAVTGGTSYAGLASRTTTGTENGSNPIVGTTATLLGGSNAGATETVSMAWRTRKVSERKDAGGIPASPPLPASSIGDPSPLISDVVSLTGLVLDGGAVGRTDPYVLQMTYNQNLLNGGAGTEGTKAQKGSIFLAWLNPNGGGPGVAQWENAIRGDFANVPGAVSNFQGDWAAAGNPLVVGSWGVDIGTHTVWAVLDHASEFGVVPEPSSLALMGLGAIGLAVGLRRKRR